MILGTNILFTNFTETFILKNSMVRVSVLLVSGLNTASNSLFTYPDGKSHADYLDENFEPIFFDPDLTNSFPDEAKRLEVSYSQAELESFRRRRPI